MKTVAIVGRPNVGKSTFFNYIVGKRISIVEDIPGVTRDRIYAEASWRDKSFTVIDTGGIEFKSDDDIEIQMKDQVDLAIDMADCILFITDMKQGVTSGDKEIAQYLRKSKKPIILVVNKADNYGDTSLDVYEFYNLGLGEPHPISSVNAIGIGDVLDLVYDNLPDEKDEEDKDRIKVSIIGKPNVGKSSLVNKILGENRVIVSDVAGTTRDATDTPFDNDKGKYVIIDTAGIRRHSKIEENVEKYSVMRSDMAIERADVCIIMIDANDGVTDQDTKIAGKAHEAGKGIIIAVNKWDEYGKKLESKDVLENATKANEMKTSADMKEYNAKIYHDLPYLTYAPIIYISALTGKNVNKLFDLINLVHEHNSFRAGTSVVNNILNEAIATVQPPSDKGRRLKIYYMTQVSTNPPTFVVFVNSKKLFHFSYERYLINRLRKEFDLTGTVVRIIVRERSEKEANK